MMYISPTAAPAPEIPRPAAVRTPIAAPSPVTAVTQAADPRTDGRASAEALNEAVAAANDAMKIVKSELDFSVDESTGRTIVRVVDKETGSVIRQMPAPELLEIAKALDKLKGILVRNSA